jgi:hypothetical protein
LLASPAAASALGVLIVLLAAAVIPLDVLARQGVLANAAQLVVGVPMAAVGLIVARRQPGNPVGWLLLVIPLGILLSLDAGPYAWLVYRMGYDLPFGPAAVLLENAYWVVLTIALPPVFVLFPDGVLPSRPWRWVLWSYRRHRPVPAWLRSHSDYHHYSGRSPRRQWRPRWVRPPIRLNGLGR